MSAAAQRRISAVVLLLGTTFAGMLPAHGQAARGSKGPIAGVIRIWGSAKMRPMLVGWEKGFQARYPGVTFQNSLYGTVTAIAGVDHKVADLAAMGRPLTVEEGMSFEWIYRYKALQLKVSTGSLDVPGESPALAIVVNRANPVTRLSLDQLRTLFVCCTTGKQSDGEAKSVSWGDAGLQGAWAAKRVHPVGYELTNGESDYFRRAALGNSYQWSCDYRGFSDGAAVVKAVSEDPVAIGFVSLAYVTPRVKVIGLSSAAGPMSVAPTRESVEEHTYPLARFTYLMVNRKPGGSVDPKVTAFLEYVLSQEGQNTIAQSSSFLRLPVAMAASERMDLTGAGSAKNKTQDGDEE